MGGATRGCSVAPARSSTATCPFAPEDADTISKVTNQLDAEIETYGDAAHAIRHRFFQAPDAAH
jgi:hypothetical protein